MSIRSYSDLNVWQKSMDLAEVTYRLTAGMPRTEIFGQISQMRRAACSIPANIAEGYGRDSTGSYLHFPRTARGSLKELETHVMLAKRVGTMRVDQADTLLAHAGNVGRMLNALIKSIAHRYNPSA